MNTHEYAAALEFLAKRLDGCEKVRRYDTTEEKQAWTLAHNLLDLAESFRTFLDEQLPRLQVESLDSDQMHALLLDIGEEFRHVLYHIRDSTFYAYLRDE